MKVHCYGCGYTGDQSEFPHGNDFMQKPYVKGCPKCKATQNPGDASMRMMPGVNHPFVFVREKPKPTASALEKTLFAAKEAS